MSRCRDGIGCAGGRRGPGCLASTGRASLATGTATLDPGWVVARFARVFLSSGFVRLRRASPFLLRRQEKGATRTSGTCEDGAAGPQGGGPDARSKEKANPGAALFGPPWPKSPCGPAGLADAPSMARRPVGAIPCAHPAGLIVRPAPRHRGPICALPARGSHQIGCNWSLRTRQRVAEKTHIGSRAYRQRVQPTARRIANAV